MARFEIIVKLLNKSLPGFGNKGDRLLDIGAGDVYVLGRLAELYPDAAFTGIDTALSQGNCEEFNRKYPNMILTREISELPKEPFRAVLLLDVIEHIEDDRGFMAGLFNMSQTEDAACIITAPAFNALFSLHDRFLGHQRRYSLAQLKSLAEHAGFDVVEGGYLFLSLLPVRGIQKIMEMAGIAKQHSNSVAAWKGYGRYDSLLVKLLLLDYALLSALRRVGINLPGLSSFVICKKQR